MIDRKDRQTVEYPTVVGADAVFKGELSCEEGIRIDGCVEGKSSAKGRLRVSQNGELRADVNTSNIVVEGRVSGNLTATDRVELCETARLEGNIKAVRLLVREGSAFVGHCDVGSRAASNTKPETKASPETTVRPETTVSKGNALPRK